MYLDAARLDIGLTDNPLVLYVPEDDEKKALRSFDLRDSVCLTARELLSLIRPQNIHNEPTQTLILRGNGTQNDTEPSNEIKPKLADDRPINVFISHLPEVAGLNEVNVVGDVDLNYEDLIERVSEAVTPEGQQPSPCNVTVINFFGTQTIHNVPEDVRLPRGNN